MKSIIRRMLHKFKIELGRYPYRGEFSAWRRVQYLKHLGIDLVVDVGANDGGFGKELRRHGYKGDIISFEPLTQAFAKLRAQTAQDKKWQVHNFGVGSAEQVLDINIAANSHSSSFLNMLDTHTKAAPQSKYVGKEKVKVTTLDSFLTSHAAWQNGTKVYLKIDTQGYEREVLKGASTTLQKVCAVQLETSLVNLYQNGFLFTESLEHMKALGYELVAVEPGFTDRTSGQQLQVDATFLNKMI